LLHHAELGGRRINVELTAGGGGAKSEVRKGRIKAKNEQLSQERKDRAAAHKAQTEAYTRAEAQGEVTNEQGSGEGVTTNSAQSQSGRPTGSKRKRKGKLTKRPAEEEPSTGAGTGAT